MKVELTSPSERNEGANGSCGVCAAREQEEIRPGSDGSEGPVARMTADDVERVRDRDALEPESAQQAVRGRLQRRPPRTGRRGEAVPDPDAGHPPLHCWPGPSEGRLPPAPAN